MCRIMVQSLKNGTGGHDLTYFSGPGTPHKQHRLGVWGGVRGAGNIP